ncbi:sensor histidine kinase [Brachybacterium hainanense]|uniref:Sensor histidine kinase n=1 Tax=Brachybacterium hainanense TaxID=1541174 RepID=A0ABV6RCS5_9MICO
MVALSTRTPPEQSSVPADDPAPREDVRPTVPPPSRPTGRFALFMERWLPVVLAAVSFGVGWQASGALGFRSTVLHSILPILATLLLRPVLTRLLRRRGAGDRRLIAVFALHQLLILVAVALNPLACIYAFIGYIDAPRFLTGRAVLVAVVGTALTCALGQAGGPEGALAVPALFGLLLLVNVLLSLGMGYLAEEREMQVAAREQAALELEQAMRENAALQEELLRRAREAGAGEERTRLAREIHDTVAQGLVGVIRQLEAVPARSLDATALRRIATAEEAARECLVDARRAVEALAPRQLAAGDLTDVLGELVARWARDHRIVATFDADRAPDPCPHGHALIRVTQEALSNIARHAGARTVEITLAAEAHGLLLRIADDGAGFDPRRAARGHGLENMQARLVELGGELRIEASPGAGCVLLARIP